MHEERALTAYCGLYCGDCIPSNTRLFEVLGELRELASELHLASYARLIAHRDASFEEYSAFERVLTALETLRCASPCREGGGKQTCEIRECARDRGFEGCWECVERSSCELLDHLRRFHGDSIDGNLDAVAERGVECWSADRGKHYPWS